jgi:hypothetical protein
MKCLAAKWQRVKPLGERQPLERRSSITGSTKTTWPTLSYFRRRSWRRVAGGLYSSTGGEPIAPTAQNYPLSRHPTNAVTTTVPSRVAYHCGVTSGESANTHSSLETYHCDWIQKNFFSEPLAKCSKFVIENQP